MSKKDSKFWEIYKYVREIIQKYFCKKCGNFDLQENDKEECSTYLEDIFFKRWENFDASRGASEKTFVNVVLANAEKDFCKKKRFTKEGTTNFYKTINIEGFSYTDEDNNSMDNPILDYFSKKISKNPEKEVIDKLMVERIFSTLTKEEILLLTLKYMDEYTSKEIASVFGTTEKRINKKIEHIKNKIRKSFNKLNEKSNE